MNRTEKRIPIHGKAPMSTASKLANKYSLPLLVDSDRAAFVVEVSALSKKAKEVRQGQTWWVAEFQLGAGGENVVVKLKPIMIEARPYIEPISYGLYVARAGSCISMCQIGGYKIPDALCHENVWLDLSEEVDGGPPPELYEHNKEAYYNLLQLHDEYCNAMWEIRCAEAKRDGLRLSIAGKSRRKVERKMKFLLWKYEKHILFTLVTKANEPDWD
jgi:hypothetical protein